MNNNETFEIKNVLQLFSEEQTIETNLNRNKTFSGNFPFLHSFIPLLFLTIIIIDVCLFVGFHSSLEIIVHVLKCFQKSFFCSSADVGHVDRDVVTFQINSMHKLTSVQEFFCFSIRNKRRNKSDPNVNDMKEFLRFH